MGGEAPNIPLFSLDSPSMLYSISSYLNLFRAAYLKSQRSISRIGAITSPALSLGSPPGFVKALQSSYGLRGLIALIWPQRPDKAV